MSYPSVLILHTTDEPFDSIEAALNLSRTWKAHIEVIVLSEPIAASRIATVGIGNVSRDVGTLSDFAVTEQRLEDIRQYTKAKSIAVSLAHHYTNEDEIQKLLSKPALYADMVIMSHWNTLTGGLHKHCLDMMLMQFKKPVFITTRRFNKTSITMDKVAIAWLENTHSMRAVQAALPLLKLANESHLIHICDNQENEKKRANVNNGNADLSAITMYLKNHSVTINITKAPTGGRFESHALIDTIRATNPDLLIMGAFGHSHIREKLFHGNTYDILENIADTNLLLTHA